MTEYVWYSAIHDRIYFLGFFESQLKKFANEYFYIYELGDSYECTIYLGEL